MTTTLAPPVRQTPAPAAPAEDLAALARRHGLSVSGARPSLPSYVRQLWSRRDFITAFATARLTAQFSQARLGQVWQVMTPLLNAAVYYLIFGVLMNAKSGVPDYVPFLVTGIFVWTFTANTIQAGTRAISGNLGLVRALHFPRASLPISLAFQQLQQLLFSLGVLAVLLACFGEFPTWSWLLAVPALFLQTLFNTGVSLVLARLAARTPDISQLMPFVLRTWMYASGAMWSIQNLATSGRFPAAAVLALQCNPAAVYIDLMRFALIGSFTGEQLPPHVWALAAGWALLAFGGGFVWFWKAEETYGRG
ncbi:ABC transporter permease [Streptomyces litmocidini]|uniref:Transport permease protein n=1 Tax=Streptomyces litmocidini TaxID=67318 RepID=A0ABW7UFQ2_9ACTN|nr:ABC transporter permease [Streptomyces sp. PanSC19]ROQ32673.1 teichoic acid transport system permease protein [Streptomyces sp. PanSC19]